MQTNFKKSFERDLKKVRDRNLLRKIADVIKEVEKAKNLSVVGNLKKLEKNHFRIRVGDYRLGVMLEEKVMVFVRALHRKEIYRYFP